MALSSLNMNKLLPQPYSEPISVSSTSGSPVYSTYSSNGINYAVYKFNASGAIAFSNTQLKRFDILVVGGGGASGTTDGNGYGSGGGAGAVFYGAFTCSNATGTNVFYVTVGAGGSNGAGGNSWVTSQPFTFAPNNMEAFFQTATAPGGGRGGDGRSSGGGASGNGYAGFSQYNSGGGGGAGGTGLPYQGGPCGGPGLSNSITGTAITYGSGGNGSAGGGPGAANTGAGGNAGGGNSPSISGGSGVVIIRHVIG